MHSGASRSRRMSQVVVHKQNAPFMSDAPLFLFSFFLQRGVGFLLQASGNRGLPPLALTPLFFRRLSSVTGEKTVALPGPTLKYKERDEDCSAVPTGSRLITCEKAKVSKRQPRLIMEITPPGWTYKSSTLHSLDKDEGADELDRLPHVDTSSSEEL